MESPFRVRSQSFWVSIVRGQDGGLVDAGRRFAGVAEAARGQQAAEADLGDHAVGRRQVLEAVVGEPAADALLGHQERGATGGVRAAQGYQAASILIIGQLSIAKWRDVIGEPTFADAILNRIVHDAHRIDLDGPSLRKAIAEIINDNAVDHPERK